MAILDENFDLTTLVYSAKYFFEFK